MLTVKGTFTTFSHGPKKMEMFTDRSLMRNKNFQLVALRASSQRNVSLFMLSLVLCCTVLTNFVLDNANLNYGVFM